MAILYILPIRNCHNSCKLTAPDILGGGYYMKPAVAATAVKSKSYLQASALQPIFSEVTGNV